GGHLEEHIDEQLQHRKQRQQGRADVETCLGLQCCDAEAVAVQHGEEVAAHGDGPDEPGAGTARGFGVCCVRVSCTRSSPVIGCLGLCHDATSLLVSTDFQCPPPEQPSGARG